MRRLISEIKCRYIVIANPHGSATWVVDLGPEKPFLGEELGHPITKMMWHHTEQYLQGHVPQPHQIHQMFQQTGSVCPSFADSTVVQPIKQEPSDDFAATAADATNRHQQNTQQQQQQQVQQQNTNSTMMDVVAQCRSVLRFFSFHLTLNFIFVENSRGKNLSRTNLNHFYILCLFTIVYTCIYVCALQIIFFQNASSSAVG